MKIKSLLIGSAAAIVAAPAFAADVIIAEPDPVEYVEVCDVAGAGYFYIPGSRTCLQIGGLVRHELGFAEDRDDAGLRFLASEDVLDPADSLLLEEDGFVDDAFFGFGVGGNAGTDGISSLVRAELVVRTYTETELGALTSFIRFRANDNNDDPFSITGNAESGELNVEGASINGSAFINDATIGLGGLLLGMSDTLYDGGIAGEFDSFGGDRVHFIRYTADLGAFSASLSLEAERDADSQNNYVPNVVGNIAGDIAFFTGDVWAYYDDGDENEVEDDFFEDDDEYGVKVRTGFDFGPAAIAVAGTYNSGDSYYDNGAEYSVGASATLGLGEKASVTFGGQYFFNAINPLGDAFDDDDNFIDDVDFFSVGANVNYEIVEGFDALIAVNYFDADIDDDIANVDITGDGLADFDVEDDDGFFSGFIRFDRSF